MNEKIRESIRARGLELLEKDQVYELLKEIEDQQLYIKNRALRAEAPRYSSYVKTFARDQDALNTKILDLLEALTIKLELLEDLAESTRRRVNKKC